MSSQVRVVSSLAMLYAFRMLGLFMVLPILTLYGSGYIGATPFLLGVALGAYGLTQALLQIPLGLLSDRIGRKKVIVLGLVLFAIGSVVAATATRIEWVIVGRALQGCGAIASAIMALVADLTSEENRTKAMASIGASIGLSFMVAMVVGPVVAGFGGLAGVFALSAGLAVMGILIITFLVPDPEMQLAHGDAGAIPRLLGRTLKNLDLLRLNWGIFTLHAVLMAMFVAVPGLLEGVGQLPRGSHWQVYLPVLSLSFLVMVPLMITSEKRRQVKPMFLMSIALLCLSMVWLYFGASGLWGMIAALFIFFVGFNFLEATLPSWISKVAPAGSKGTAMGIYSTSQFFGAFLGGILGGWVVSNYGTALVFAVCAMIIGAWFVVAMFMTPPKHLQNVCYSVEPGFNHLSGVLGLEGVEEGRHDADDHLLYLKVDKKRFNELELTRYQNWGLVLSVDSEREQ